MRVHSISAFRPINPTKTANLKALNNKQNNNSYNLPNYQTSFGMAKAQINHPNYFLERDIKEEIKEAVSDITKDMQQNQNSEAEYLRIDALVKKFKDDKAALKYIFECSRIEDNPDGESFAVAYLFALRDNRDEEEWQKGEWNKFMTNLLCKSKNQTGYTLPQLFAIDTFALESIFDSVNNHPVILHKILTNTDINGFSIGDIAAHSKDKGLHKFLNEKLYYLAGEDKSINKDDAIRLLTANEAVLDDANKELLQSFLSE